MCFNFMAQLLSDVLKKPRALPVEAGGVLSCLHRAGRRAHAYLPAAAFSLLIRIFWGVRGHCTIKPCKVKGDFKRQVDVQCKKDHFSGDFQDETSGVGNDSFGRDLLKITRGFTS